MSTDAASESPSILEVIGLEETFDRLASEEWKALPTSTEKSLAIDNRVFAVKPFIKRCEGSVPSEQEIADFLKHVQNTCEPVYWLYRLGYLQVVDFPEGQDPTVEDFFAGKYDPSTLSTKAALICYPLVESK